MKLLVFGDLHLKPSGQSVDYDALSVSTDIDAVVSLGDLTHRAEAADRETAREFLAHVAADDRPVVCVPGNHDPHDHYTDLLGELAADGVVDAHDRRVTPDGVGFALVGWGCEEFHFEPELHYAEMAALDPRERDGDRRHVADVLATAYEDLLVEYGRGERSREGLLDGLVAVGDEGTAELTRRERAALREQLDAFDAAYDRLTGLLDGSDETVLLSHVPPFNTALDRHHSHGTREDDLEGLHWGSMVLKTAIRTHRPLAVLCGHSHTQGYDVCRGDGGETQLLNPGFRGVATVDVSRGGFAYQFF
ncbi:Calcineurin-like phosphoesterase superfamily domain-containing protein [Halogranum gelatinilyticum]|uniref:Calcineurin-like phosphoesterase superfamily domain-containing protein n=1 Tax=Halogranum gelatinilyticum TaxID=660521 RepID=A0A1G9TW85_9EURY|nr:metallophosphoesterase [Halogranum gelatinilyticum]SDM51922.1 Calcineurin-like phosphoesterase superfamily domain-containing protein [Halogranum gelatinilyticum]